MQGFRTDVEGADQSIEWANWRDTGCSLHPSCLQCPRSVCRYDEAVSWGGQRRASILSTVTGLRSLVDSIGAKAVAEIYGVDKRSVFRELARRRKG